MPDQFSTDRDVSRRPKLKALLEQIISIVRRIENRLIYPERIIKYLGVLFFVSASLLTAYQMGIKRLVNKIGYTDEQFAAVNELQKRGYDLSSAAAFQALQSKENIFEKFALLDIFPDPPSVLADYKNSLRRGDPNATELTHILAYRRKFAIYGEFVGALAADLEQISNSLKPDDINFPMGICRINFRVSELWTFIQPTEVRYSIYGGPVCSNVYKSGDYIKFLTSALSSITKTFRAGFPTIEYPDLSNDKAYRFAVAAEQRLVNDPDIVKNPYMDSVIREFSALQVSQSKRRVYRMTLENPEISTIYNYLQIGNSPFGSLLVPLINMPESAKNYFVSVAKGCKSQPQQGCRLTMSFNLATVSAVNNVIPTLFLATPTNPPN